MLVVSALSIVGPLFAILNSTAGCGDGSAPRADDIPTTGRDSALIERLPEDIRGAGVLQIGTDASSPSMEFLEPGGEELVGFDIDLGRAIGQMLGLKVEWTNPSSAALVPALQSGRFNLALASAQDLPERQEIFDCRRLLQRWIEPARVERRRRRDRRLRVAVRQVAGGPVGQRNSSAQRSSKRVAQTTPSTPELSHNDAAFLALNSGRVDAVFAQTIVNAYVMSKTPGQYAVSEDVYEEAPIGVVVVKGSPMVAVVRDAITALIKVGTYSEIVAKWELEIAAVDKVLIDAG